MTEGRWEFYTRIAEMCDTARRDDRIGSSMLAYHLRQAENQARVLAGERPKGYANELSSAE